MVEPVSAGTLVVIADVYTRVMTKLTSNVPARLAAIEDNTKGILSAINVQNEAHFRAAEMALRREDQSRALECLEQGLSVDPINAAGWKIYGMILGMQGRHELAKSIFTQMLSWFGPGCPYLPENMGELCRSHDTIEVPSANSIRNIIGISGKWVYAGNTGISDTGAAAAFYNITGITSGLKSKVEIHFHPWTANAQRCVFRTDDWTASTPWLTCANGSLPVFTHMTNRFICLESGSVIDLGQNDILINAGKPTISAVFGAKPYGVSAYKEPNRGVGIEDHSDPDPRFWAKPSDIVNPRVIVTPKIRASK